MDRNESAPAIVIKSERYKERDRIITLLSPVWGLRRVVVYGAQKSRKAVKASLYTEAVFHIYENRERRQTSLVDLNIISIHENVSESLETSFAASLMCEIIMKEKGEDAPAYYSLLTGMFDTLSAQNYRRAVIQFVIRALDISGLAPDFIRCPDCGRRYTEAEILGFSRSGLTPCCSDCDSLSGSFILPPNARRYLKDSLSCDAQKAMGFEISERMETSLMRYTIRLYRMVTSAELKSALMLSELSTGTQDPDVVVSTGNKR